MIQQECSVIKDGYNYRALVKETDTDKPKVWVEGHYYHFNQRIVADSKVTASHILQMCGATPGEVRPTCV